MAYKSASEAIRMQKTARIRMCVIAHLIVRVLQALQSKWEQKAGLETQVIQMVV